MIKSVATAVAGFMFVIGFAMVGFAPKTSVADSASTISTAKLKPSAEMLKSY